MRKLQAALNQARDGKERAEEELKSTKEQLTINVAQRKEAEAAHEKRLEETMVSAEKGRSEERDKHTETMKSAVEELSQLRLRASELATQLENVQQVIELAVCVAAHDDLALWIAALGGSVWDGDIHQRRSRTE